MRNDTEELQHSPHPPQHSEGNLRLSPVEKKKYQSLPNEQESLSCLPQLWQPQWHSLPQHRPECLQCGALKGLAAVCLSQLPSCRMVGAQLNGQGRTKMQSKLHLPTEYCPRGPSRKGQAVFWCSRRSCKAQHRSRHLMMDRGAGMFSELLPSRVSDGESVTVAKVNQTHTVTVNDDPG